MNLGALIEALERMDPEETPLWGFSHAHSYRGFYDCLAFEPSIDATYGEMLAEAKSCIGRTFKGYKGGDYTMTEDTKVFLARYGETGQELRYGFYLGGDGTQW